MKRCYAVVDRDGFGHGNETRVASTHRNTRLAVAAAKRRGALEDGRHCLMVISSKDGFERGQTVYRDSIRRLYPVIW